MLRCLITNKKKLGQVIRLIGICTKKGILKRNEWCIICILN